MATISLCGKCLLPHSGVLKAHDMCYLASSYDFCFCQYAGVKHMPLYYNCSARVVVPQLLTFPEAIYHSQHKLSDFQTNCPIPYLRAACIPILWNLDQKVEASPKSEVLKCILHWCSNNFNLYPYLIYICK